MDISQRDGAGGLLAKLVQGGSVVSRAAFGGRGAHTLDANGLAWTTLLPSPLLQLQNSLDLLAGDKLSRRTSRLTKGCLVVPALPDVPDTIEVVLTGNDGGDNNITNKYYFTYTGTADATSLNTLLGIVASSWSANIAPMVHQQYHLTQIVINDLNSKTGAKVAETVNIAGTRPGTGIQASGVAAVVSFKEPLKYRGGHGRTYLGGLLHEDAADANTWSTVFQAALQAAIEAFIAQIISAAPAALNALKHVIVHRFSKTGVPPVRMDGYKVTALSVPLNPPVTHAVTGYVCNPQVASQRRRNQQTG